MELKILINELKNLISSSYDCFKGIYLYGSRVKGNIRGDSDIDIDIVILFELPLSNNEELDLAGIIGEMEYKYDVFIDYHPFTLTELKKNPFFYEEVVDKGIYYEAA